ncbi:MAG TPA: hypothetical protein VNZ45_14050, partial [Bacteroidia bacterium]|nr:hypothetical protein [Bacteroidia bacterium]
LTVKLSDTLCDGTYSITLSDGNSNFGNSPQGWTANLYYPTTNLTFSLGILPSDPAGNCYKFRVDRVTPPLITGVASGCVVIENCPSSITTLQPLVTTDTAHPVCAGSVIQVPFWSTGTYGAINTYIAELSDSAGNFTGYTGDSIGFFPSNSAYPPTQPNPGVVSGLIPFNIPASCHYYIRVVSDTPHTYGAPWGPFCIQHCDIESNLQASVQACIKSCYLDPKGYNDSINIKINKYDSNENYISGNKFAVQLLSTKTFAIVNTGGFGVKVDTITGNMELHVPCGDSLCQMFSLGSPPTGTYYMRIIATKSNQPDSTYGTLVFLTIGYPQDSLGIISFDNTSTFCMGDVPGFMATNYDNSLFCTQGYQYSDWSWWVNKTNAVLNSPLYFSIGLPMPSSLVPAVGKYNLIVQEQNNGCYGPRDTMKITVNAAPAVSITGPITLCEGDTGTYSVVFTNNSYYKWSAKYASSVDTANNVIKVKYDTVGRFEIKIHGLDSCGAD